MNSHFRAKSTKTESQCLGDIGPDHYATGIEDTATQGDFVGGPKLENSKSKMTDGCHIGNLVLSIDVGHATEI